MFITNNYNFKLIQHIYVYVVIVIINSKNLLLNFEVVHIKVINLSYSPTHVFECKIMC